MELPACQGLRVVLACLALLRLQTLLVASLWTHEIRFSLSSLPFPLSLPAAEWRGAPVALKVISVPVSQCGRAQWQQVLGEAAIATLLNHPNVLQMGERGGLWVGEKAFPHVWVAGREAWFAFLA